MVPFAPLVSDRATTTYTGSKGPGRERAWSGERGARSHDPKLKSPRNKVSTGLGAGPQRPKLRNISAKRGAPVSCPSHVIHNEREREVRVVAREDVVGLTHKTSTSQELGVAASHPGNEVHDKGGWWCRDQPTLGCVNGKLLLPNRPKLTSGDRPDVLAGSQLWRLPTETRAGTDANC
eukprot:scaffold63069_cov32-Tisochrysis_lutea.AAC.2